MLMRKIVKIDENKCDGCGQCVSACPEGAIAMVKGKARVVNETYCDGLGACIGECPQGAISIETREAPAFSEEAMKKHLQKTSKAQHRHQTAPAEGGFVCPGTLAKRLREIKAGADAPQTAVESHLTHWPVQLKLVSANAAYLKNADVLLAGDCVPFAMGDFHSKLLKDHCVLVGCPKLDDAQYYIEKLGQILKINKPRSLTVVHMEVPCCFGLKRIAEAAVEMSEINLSVDDITISLEGKIL
jgi:NAD-dependent dihydropyrimidine dehydrogenase PreA subunit